MPSFQYEAYTPDGRRERGQLMAETRADLVLRLKQRGLLIAAITEDDGKRISAPLNRHGIGRGLFAVKPSVAQFAQLFGELSTLVSAGIPISEAITLTAQRQKHASMVERLLTHVQDALTNGENLSTALSAQRFAVPKIVTALVTAGEARGNLGAALLEAAEHLGRRAAIEDKLRSTLIYPLILAVVAVVAVGIILAFLVPNLLPLFEGTGIKPPTVLHYASVLGIFLEAHGQAILIATCCLLIALIPVGRTHAAQRVGAKLLLKLPWFGPVLRQRNTALFARTLGTLLRSDVAMPTALDTAANVMPNPLLAVAAEAVRHSVTGGAPLSEAITRSGIFSPILIRFTSVGEQSGRLPDMLLHYADLTEKTVEQSIERFMALLAPLLTIGIGLFVGALILSVLQAIMSINQLAVGV